MIQQGLIALAIAVAGAFGQAALQPGCADQVFELR